MTHGLHPYPARMIPQVAGKLIDKYAKDSDVVCFDPFCGSGTVLVESKLRTIKSIGVDSNPLAILISKVKVTPISSEALLRERSATFKGITDDIASSSNVEIPKIKNLDYWFKPEVSTALALIKNNIDAIRDNDVSDFYKVCFSLTVRKVSNTRPGEFKLFRIPENKLKSHKPDVVRVFFDTVDSNIHKMSEFFEYLKENDVASKVIKGDTRSLMDLCPDVIYEGCSNLLVTSPPYGDSHTTVAYGQFSRYSAAWLGFEDEEVWKMDKNSLGGKVFTISDDLESPTLSDTLELIAKSDKFRAKETYSFFRDLDECFGKISKVMKQGNSHICFVLGNRTVKRVQIPSDKILIELGKKYGFKHLDTKHRGIPNKHMPARNAPENVSSLMGDTMSKENIVIWKY